MADQISSMPNSNWQQSALEKVLLETLKEQKRKRRWGIFFKLIYLIIFISIVYAISNSNSSTSGGDRDKPHTAVININGEIAADQAASADNMVASIDKAFKDSNTRGIILRINSPGGSPVQADYVYNDIMRQRSLHPNIKIYAVCSDLCASAAYYIASATNDIYADPASIVGSIGVLMNGFGFVDTMQKLGVERRLIISGSEKGFLDPFSPMTPQDKAYAQTMLDLVHQQFITAVEKGRGKRLKNSPDLFSGLAWTGTQALQMGLIDGFGSAGFVARQVIGNNNIVDYTKKPSLFNQFGNEVGASFYQHFAADFGLYGPQLR